MCVHVCERGCACFSFRRGGEHDESRTDTYTGTAAIRSNRAVSMNASRTPRLFSTSTMDDVCSASNRGQCRFTVTGPMPVKTCRRSPTPPSIATLTDARRALTAKDRGRHTVHRHACQDGTSLTARSSPATTAAMPAAESSFGRMKHADTLSSYGTRTAFAGALRSLPACA